MAAKSSDFIYCAFSRARRTFSIGDTLSRGLGHSTSSGIFWLRCLASLNAHQTLSGQQESAARLTLLKEVFWAMMEQMLRRQHAGAVAAAVAGGAPSPSSAHVPHLGMPSDPHYRLWQCGMAEPALDCARLSTPLCFTAYRSTRLPYLW